MNPLACHGGGIQQSGNPSTGSGYGCRQYVQSAIFMRNWAKKL